MADDKLRATPAARKLADDLGINLYDILAQVQTVVSTKKTWKLIKTQTWFAFRHLQNEIALEHNIAWQEDSRNWSSWQDHEEGRPCFPS